MVSVSMKRRGWRTVDWREDCLSPRAAGGVVREDGGSDPGCLWRLFVIVAVLAAESTHRSDGELERVSDTRR